jgi:hypothetical protein
MGAKFAGPAAVSVYNARLLMEARHRAEQLQRALGSRSVIDQAIGIIRGRSGASAEEAFGWLVKVSQSENVKLHVIAERLVEESVPLAPAPATTDPDGGYRARFTARPLSALLRPPGSRGRPSG